MPEVLPASTFRRSRAAARPKWPGSSSAPGGVAHVSPSMREVPIAENRPAIDFANRVVTGQIDIVIFMTGVGVRHLIAEVERYVDRPRFLAALSDVTTIARGPKPVAVLKEFGLEPTVRVPEPNTWREVLATIDLCVPVAQQNVGLLEYGRPNASLVAGLEARGARVEAVRVYRWELPEDIAPLTDNLRAIAAGQRQVALFTSSHQVVNLLRVAEDLGLTAAGTRVAGADGHRLDWTDHQRDFARARPAGRYRARAQQNGSARGPGRRAFAPVLASKRSPSLRSHSPQPAAVPRGAARDRSAGECYAGAGRTGVRKFIHAARVAGSRSSGRPFG